MRSSNARRGFVYYPVSKIKLYKILFEKLKPTCGAWINKLYLLSRLTPDLNQVPPYTAGSGRNYEGLSADIDGDTQEQRYKRGGEQAEFAGVLN
jgi:hypothetical protein